MREYISIVEQALRSGDKIHRNAFLYLESSSKNSQFAQCSSCMMWISQEQKCVLFGDQDKVVANASCGLYVEGQPQPDARPLNKVSPEAAGYNTGQVRCENCSWFNSDQSSCGLFNMLTDQSPDVFDLDSDVQPQGCCNAWQKQK